LLRRQLVEVGIARERHRMGELITLLPVRLNGKPYEDFDADIVAEVLVYLVGKGMIEVPSTELSGLRVTWGERLCHFYRSEEELLGLLVPYFRQGLEHGERCMWVAGASKASEKTRQAIASLTARQHAPEQLEVVDVDDWTPDIDAWSREQERALAQGYSGLRICGEALDLAGEVEITRTKALSTYSAQGASGEVHTVILRHDAALVKNIDVWQRIPTADPHAAATIISALME
jgi:hypothetical protein